MEISHRRLDLAVAQDLHHVGQADTLTQGLRDHDRRGRVAEVVENEVPDSGVFPDPPDHVAHIYLFSSIAQRQHIAVRPPPVPQFLQNSLHRVGQRDDLLLLLFCLSSLQSYPVLTDVLPFQVENFPGPHACIKQQQDDPPHILQGPGIFLALPLHALGRVQDPLELLRSVLPSLLVDRVRPDLGHWILADIFLPDCVIEERLQEAEIMVDRGLRPPLFSSVRGRFLR
jgi:hypothetical protein